MSISEKLLRAKTDYDEVFKAGKQAEYDKFWDALQQNGNRVHYYSEFANGRCNMETFFPKYDMVPVNAQYMFAYNGNSSAVYSYTTNIVTDLKKRLDDSGVKLDTSKCTNLTYMFYAAGGITHLPEISAESCISLSSLFYGCTYLETIDKLILRQDGANTFAPDKIYERTFFNCVNLRNIIIEGVIGDTVSFEWCPLSKESIVSIINALSPTATEKTVTFRNSTKEAAFTADEWADIVATKPNWKIELL